jgi:hypothetical protein
MLSEMKPATADSCRALLERSGIVTAAPHLGIGNELHYAAGARRTVVVQFGDADTSSYLGEVAMVVLGLEDEWFLMTRYGEPADLGLIACEEAGAIACPATSCHVLAEYLSTRPGGAGEISADLYVLSQSGEILITWDHHTASDGLQIQLLDIGKTSRLLVALNELGAEFEVYYDQMS